MSFRVLTDLPTGAQLERLRRERGRSHVIHTDPRLRLLTRYGAHCLAYSSLQPGLAYFLLDGVGYLAFRSEGPHHVVLGNPLCSVDAYASIAEAFWSYSESVGAAVLWVQASSEAADTLASRGFQRRYLGVETSIPLAHYDLAGPRKSTLRRARSRARAAGVSARELPSDEVDPAEEQRVSDEWQRGKRGVRLKFLVRPFVTGGELDVRRFYGFVGEKMVAVMSFDPMYQAGKIVGYYQQHMLRTEDAPPGTLDLVTLTALQQFQRDGLRSLSLGLSPFAAVEKFEDKQRHYYLVAQKIFELGARTYSLRGNYFHKSRYRGDETPVFLLERPDSGLGGLKLLVRLTGLSYGVFAA